MTKRQRPLCDSSDDRHDDDSRVNKLDHRFCSNGRSCFGSNNVQLSGCKSNLAELDSHRDSDSASDPDSDSSRIMSRRSGRLATERTKKIKSQLTSIWRGERRQDTEIALLVNLRNNPIGFRSPLSKWAPIESALEQRHVRRR